MIKNTEDCVKHINKVQVEQKFSINFTTNKNLDALFCCIKTLFRPSC